MLRETSCKARPVSGGAVSALKEKDLYAYEPRIVSHRTRTWDAARTESAVRELLDSLGVDVSSEDTRQTPRRVAEMYHEMLIPKPFKFTTFPNADRYDELVLVRAIPLVSLCAHHLLPFKGEVHVGYVPGERIVGLSKLARAVQHFAKALQVQERLTKQIADLIQDELEPKGVGVIMEAEHQCMTVRGVQAMGAKTVTSTLYGLLRDNQASRAEFLSLAGIGTR
jgi:GTP cyclohydrolase IA